MYHSSRCSQSPHTRHNSKIQTGCPRCRHKIDGFAWLLETILLPYAQRHAVDRPATPSPPIDRAGPENLTHPQGCARRKPAVRACPASSFLELSIVENGTVGPTPGLSIKRAPLPDNLFIVHSHPSQAEVCPIVAFHTALQAQPRADLSPQSAAD